MDPKESVINKVVNKILENKGDFVLREHLTTGRPDPEPTNYEFGATSTFIRGVSVLLLRGGLIMIQMSCVPVTNLKRVVVQNIVDIVCGIIAYSVFGFVISFGKDVRGIFGYTDWLFKKDADMNNAVYGWSCVCIATGLYTTVLAGRLNFVAYVLTSVMMSGVLLPLFMHWILSPNGWMFRTYFHGYLVTYKDYGGGMIIHCSAGLVAVINCVILGRRLIKLDDIDEGSIPLSAPIHGFVAYILLMIGLMGFCIPTPIYEITHEPSNHGGLIFINNILAAAGGVLIVIILQFAIFRKLLPYWSVIRYLQGGLAGMVIITSGVDVYNPHVAFFLGLLGGLMYYLVSYGIFFHLAIEDYPNIIAIHLMNGFLSSLFPPLAGVRDGFGIADKILIHLAWQIIGSLVIFAATGVSMALFTFALKLCRILKNADEERNHKRAQTVSSQYHPKSFAERLWAIDNNTNLIEPGIGIKKKLYKGTGTIG